MTPVPFFGVALRRDGLVHFREVVAQPEAPSCRGSQTAQLATARSRFPPRRRLPINCTARTARPNSRSPRCWPAASKRRRGSCGRAAAAQRIGGGRPQPVARRRPVRRAKPRIAFFRPREAAWSKLVGTVDRHRRRWRGRTDDRLRRVAPLWRAAVRLSASGRQAAALGPAARETSRTQARSGRGRSRSAAAQPCRLARQARSTAACRASGRTAARRRSRAGGRARNSATSARSATGPAQCRHLLLRRAGNGAGRSQCRDGLRALQFHGLRQADGRHRSPRRKRQEGRTNCREAYAVRGLRRQAHAQDDARGVPEAVALGRRGDLHGRRRRRGQRRGAVARACRTCW